ncbi:MAG: ABC transporter permease [Spirochaetales bacterium]|jgi:general nucleoside transport system permease protein|nr:ABC transporter permease [Spirochaetales bacterium]
MDAGILISVLQRTIIMGTPLLIATIGEVIAERSGILNLGVEGMMAMGAVSAFIATLSTGNPWIGMIVGILVGAAAALLHAIVTVSLQANQVVSGLALTMLGLGASGLWGKPYIGTPLTVKMDAFRVPLLGKIPIIGDIFFYQDAFFFLAVFLGIAAWFMLKHTRWGVYIRSVGENPKASESQGINVSIVRYICVVIGGGFAGMAGANLSISYSKSWIEGMTAGRGWIVIGLTIFALWRPPRAFFGAFLFGGIFVLQYLLQPLGIPPNLLGMMPYLATLVVLVFNGIGKGKRRMAAPAALGEPYRRGER